MLAYIYKHDGKFMWGGGKGIIQKSLYLLKNNFILGLKFYFPLIQTHYRTLPCPQNKGKIKFKPRLKLNHSIYTYLLNSMSEGRVSTKSESE